MSMSAVSDGEALALVTEMMSIPGRSGEEAAVMDFIRTRLAEVGATLLSTVCASLVLADRRVGRAARVTRHSDDPRA